MKKWSALLVLLFGLVILNSCQKETSFEGSGLPATGSLQVDGSGDCLPKSVVGIYEAGTALAETNYIDVTLNVTGSGRYIITTDSVNGFYFRSAGFFTTTGQRTVRLRGYGTPIEAGTHSFIINFDSSSCVVQVITLPEGAGGPAAFTFDGAPGGCTAVNVQGIYTAGVALTANNTVALNINVTTIGTYNITTQTVNGISFTGAGTLATPGPATITLVGNGVPVAGGNSNIPTPGTSVCTFSVPVLSPAQFTIDCAGASVAGNYRTNESLTPANQITVAANVTTPGGYSITTVTTNGMVFTASGQFTSTGVQSLVFNGSGTPANEGTTSISISINSRSCSVPVVVTGGTVATGEWRFTIGGVTRSGAFEDATLDISSVNGMQVGQFVYDGTNSADDFFLVEFVDFNGVINVGETYKTFITLPTENPGQFGWQNADGSSSFVNEITDNGAILTFTITRHDVATRRIEATFAGNTRDQDGVVRAVTNGFFSGNYVQ